MYPIEKSWPSPYLVLPEVTGEFPIIVTHTGCNTYRVSLENIVPPTSTSCYYGYDSHDNVDVISTNKTLQIDVNVINDAIYVNTSGLITINSSGIFEIIYHVQFQSLDSIGSERASLECVVELNTGSGFNPLPGSGSRCYLRSEAGNIVSPGTGKNVLTPITAGNVIRIVHKRVIGSTSATLVANQSSLIIKQIQ